MSAMRVTALIFACVSTLSCGAVTPAPASPSPLAIPCDGTADVTSLIQSALNSPTNLQCDTNGPTSCMAVSGTVVLPQGTCLITRPLVLGPNGSLVGQRNGTTIFADFAKWPANALPIAIEVVLTSVITSQERLAERTISDMLIVGSNNSTLASTGIRLYSTSNTAGTVVTDQIPYFKIANVQVTAFDTGIELDDVVASTIVDTGISQVRVGVTVNGNVANTVLSNLQIQYPTLSHTSRSGLSTGILILAHTYAGGQYSYPQGLIVHDSSVIAFDYSAQVNSCLSCNFHDNIFDYGASGPSHSGATVQVGPLHDFKLTANYIATSGYVAVALAAPIGPQGLSSNNDGIWIQRNSIVSYNSSLNPVGIGIAPSSYSHRSLHLDDNQFEHFVQGIELNGPISFSTIRGNYGSDISSSFINLNGSFNQTHAGLLVEGNSVSSSVPAVNVGSSAGASVVYNYSPTQ